ncbi:MAG TPA: NYN domain-containing protein [Candidatus Glassbacteria bacterium]|nr:NYN domain-containing protein [Candidatus Glassbacteria bacterium]
MQNANDTRTQFRDSSLPSDEQLRLLLENLFERQRLVELAHRCTTRDESLDLRQARSDELIEILLRAWISGPKRIAGSLWGAIDQELAARFKSYLGLGEQRLREMVGSLQSEGSFDRKTGSTLLWVILHERHMGLLEEFEPVLSHRFRDSGSLLATRPLCITRLNSLEAHIDGVGREIKGMLVEQSRELDALRKRLEAIEPTGAANRERPFTGGSDALRRRLEEIPRENVRLGLFVDVQNMFYAAKKLDGARLDYESMLDHILAGRRLIKAAAYIVESSEIDQSGFISVLEKKGYQVRRKELKSFTDGTAKGDWDMGIAIDIIELAPYLDVVALVSGDGDFVSLVRLIKKLGPTVELYAFGHNLSSELRETADRFIEIGSNLLLKNYGSQSSASHTAESAASRGGDTSGGQGASAQGTA